MMKIAEIASAEDQLTLWKTISDSVWATIRQQAEAEAVQHTPLPAQRPPRLKSHPVTAAPKHRAPPPHKSPPQKSAPPPAADSGESIGLQRLKAQSQAKHQQQKPQRSTSIIRTQPPLAPAQQRMQQAASSTSHTAS